MSFDSSHKAIQLNKTVIESDLLVWSEHLKNTLDSGNYEAFCHHKSELTPSNDLQLAWKFLKTMFQNNPKQAQLELLGYSSEINCNVVSQLHYINGVEISSNDKVIKS